MRTGTIPLQQLGDDNQTYSFSLNLEENGKDRALRAEAFDLWRRRMGHISARSFEILNKAQGNGLSCCGDGLACDVCAIGKSAQQARPKSAMCHVKFPLQLVFTNLTGPIALEALPPLCEQVTDAATRWRGIYLLKDKSDAVASLKLLNQAVVIPSGSCIQRLRTDKEGEYTNEVFEDYCLQMGIMHEFASTATPQHIGMSQCGGETLAGMVRCILTYLGLPKFLWGELMLTAAYPASRVPHAALKNITPHKARHNKEANLEHLRVIGARAFVHIERYKKTLDPRAW